MAECLGAAEREVALDLAQQLGLVGRIKRAAHSLVERVELSEPTKLAEQRAYLHEEVGVDVLVRHHQLLAQE